MQEGHPAVERNALAAMTIGDGADGAESGVAGDHVEHLPGRPHQSDFHRVEVWVVRAPQLWRGDRDADRLTGRSGTDGDDPAGHLRDEHNHALVGGARGFRRDGDGIEIGCDVELFKVGGGHLL